MGKNRNIFQKPGKIERTFHARMGMMKDRHGKDLTETGKIKKIWKEYTEELHKKS